MLDYWALERAMKELKKIEEQRQAPHARWSSKRELRREELLRQIAELQLRYNAQTVAIMLRTYSQRSTASSGTHTTE